MDERGLIKMPHPQLTDISGCMVLSEQDILPVKKFVRKKDGAQLYDVSEVYFMQLAEEAEAVYKIGKITLINMSIVDDYLEQFHADQRKRAYYYWSEWWHYGIQKVIDILTFIKYNIAREIIKGGAYLMAKMGRPSVDNPKQNQITIRLNDEDYAKLKEYAQKNNLSIAHIVRESAMKAIQQES